MKLQTFMPLPHAMPFRVLILQGSTDHLRDKLAEAIHAHAPPGVSQLCRAKDFYPGNMPMGDLRLRIGHNECYKFFRTCLGNNAPLIIVDNKNFVTKQMEPYWEAAIDHGYSPMIISVIGMLDLAEYRLEPIPTRWSRCYIKKDEIQTLLQETLYATS